jgi:alcohol dehydrogenase class IV
MCDIAPERFGPIAEGFDVRFDPGSPRAGAMECAERAAQFIRGFEVPNRLRDAGVPEDQIGKIADTVLEEVKRSNTVGRDVTREELIGILRAAY